MQAGREFNYYGFKEESLYGSMAQGMDNYLSFRTKNYVQFDMNSLYPKDPQEKVKIMQEIYDTERSYVLSLTLVDEVFFQQLALSCPKSKKHLRTVFGELPAICKTHQILLESFRKIPIAEAFTKLIPFLKLYTSYASHYPNALKVFAKLMARNDFRRALTRIEEDPKCEGKNLQAYLIMPVQRIPRYILLIQNLMHYSTGQADMTSLFKALSGMQSLSEQIQSCMTAYENGERLLDIQLNFGLDGHILEPGRVLLKEGMLYKRELNGASNYQETVVFLFNDILLYGVKRISVMPLCKYEPSAILSLRHCIVQYDEVSGSIFIRCGDVGVDFTAYPLGGVAEWYNEIVDAIDNAKKLRDTLRKESFKQKSLVFDRGFWQRNRDRLRNMITADVTAHVNRVLSRRRPLPKLDESDFLRGEWTTSPGAANRKRKTVALQDDEDVSQVKRVLKEQDVNFVSYAQPPTIQLSPTSTRSSRKCRMESKGPAKAAKEVKKDEEDDSDIDFTWSDDEEYVPEEKKIPIRRVASFDEEDRRPRNSGDYRRSVISAPGRRGLAVSDIRKLSYQHRTYEPFNMCAEDDDEEVDDIEVKVKGERPRPWWETESAPPAIKNQKTSLIDSVKNNCSLM